MVLGKDTFNESIFQDYFDAYEFRNKKNEIYNRAFLTGNDLGENLRFVTESDCHNWEYYPNTEKQEKTQFAFTILNRYLICKVQYCMIISIATRSKQQMI